MVASRRRTAPLPDLPENQSWTDVAAPVGCLLGALSLLGLVVIGGWTVIRWLWP